MQLEIPAPLAIDNARLFGSGKSPRGAADDIDTASDATLRLLRTCVEAMGLLQAKVEGLEVRMVEGAAGRVSDAGATRTEMVALRGQVERLEASLRERVEGEAFEATAIRSDVADLRAALISGTTRLLDTENRTARMEVSVQEFVTRHADDIAVARAEAAHWRMRTETDAMAFDQLSTRLTAMEQGLVTKLDDAKLALAEREQENVRLQSETRVVEGASDRLRTRITTLDATIADQRARISCLQNKLATATYAIRFEHMSRTMETAGDLDILDLAALSGDSLVSAA